MIKLARNAGDALQPSLAALECLTVAALVYNDVI